MKVAVIGGGPGGYVAAIRAAQLGAEVTLIEKGKTGGVCVNAGCIPTKSLLHSAELLADIKRSGTFGIEVSGEVAVNWEKVQGRKNDVVETLVSGIEGLLRVNGVKVIKGTGSFESPHSIAVMGEGGSTETLNFDRCIIATGSVPFIPAIEGRELPGVIDSTGALELPEIPESMVIIGGGVIGVEMASVYSSFGCRVAIIEMLPHILPPVDRELGLMVRKKLEDDGIAVHTDSRVTRIEQAGVGRLKVSFRKGDRDLSEEADKVLVAVGRRADTAAIGLENAGVETLKGFVKVNDRMETNVPGIYAIGDCTGKNMLAHVAYEQGMVAAERIMGRDSSMDYKTVPACVYTKPELASVGMTEEQVKEKGILYRVGRFPLVGNAKSLILDETEGIVKVIADEKYGEILGVHILGPRATDLIAEGALALRLECTTEELITTIHAHPTVSEAVREAALSVTKEAIHIQNR